MAEGNSPSLVPRWTLAVHAVQLLFAVIILGFDAYGIKYIPYNALIFSLVVCLCTMAVCAYLIASQTFIPKMYNVYVSLAVHVWLLIFWVVDLGLVANLAAMWGRGDYCFTTYYGYGSTYCYTKRDLQKRDTTTFAAYYGILAAGAVFAAIQLVTWALTAGFLLMAWNKQRTSASTSAQPNSTLPPQYHNNGQAVPLEKYDHNTATTTTPAPAPAQQYAAPQAQYATPQPQYVQPPPQQYGGGSFSQDPVQRQDTVSPVSHAGGYASNPNVSEVSSPQHTGQYTYPPNVQEVHTDPYNPNVPELANQR